MASIEANGARGHHKFTLNVNETYVSGGAENYSTVSWSLVLSPVQTSWDWYISGIYYSVTIDGQNWSGEIPSYDGYSTVTIASGTKNVSHDSDGGKYIGFSFNINDTVGASYTPGNASSSGGMNLTKIPRYANITSLSIPSRTETTLNVSFKTDRNAWIFAKVNDGAWLNNGEPFISNASSGTFTITGLSAGTNYKVTVLSRADGRYGSLDTTKDISTSTYSYPYCTSSPNFTIGNSLTLGLYNPLKRSVTVSLLTTSDSVLATGTTSGTSISGFDGDTAIQNMYNSIPNSTSGKYKVKVTYGSSNKIRFIDNNNNNNYIVNANINKPTFEDFDYSTNLRELTGNYDTVVNGVTTTTFTILSSNKAVAKNGATMQRYSCVCGDDVPTIVNYSDNDVTAQVSNCKSNIIKVTAIDSRGLETTVSKTVTNFKTYSPPSFASATIEREDGIEETAFVDTKINFWNFNFGTRRNNINSLKYRVKEKSSENWSNWFSINTSSLVITGQEATLENYMVYLDGISEGFQVGVVYQVQLQVIDGSSNYDLSTVESDIFELGDGQVAFSIFRDNNGNYHIGINGMPSETDTLKVHGNISNS